MGCNENGSKQQEELQLNNQTTDPTFEKANPETLDLTIHQLFIDSTKNSKFQNKLRSWNSSTEEEIKQKVPHFTQNFSSDIPKRWVTIQKYKDQFYNYDRCDGSDPRLEILGNALIFEGIHEKRIEEIKKIKPVNKGWTITTKNNTLQIERINNNIYILKFCGTNSTKSYITPFSNIDQFELLVNNCGNDKVDEFGNFQQPD